MGEVFSGILIGCVERGSSSVSASWPSCSSVGSVAAGPGDARGTASHAPGESVGGAHTGPVRALGVDLDLAPAEERFVHREGRLDELLRAELDVREAFRVAVRFVAQDCDPVDGSTAVEVRLQLLSRRSVVYVSDVD